MKTFLEFIAEAELIDIENDQQELSKIRREIAELQRRGRPGDDEKIKELIQKASPLANKVKRSAQLAAAGNEVLKQIQDKPKEPENKNTWVSGKPKTQKGGEISSVGTQSNVARQRITNMRTGQDLGSASTPGMGVSGLHSDTSSRSQKGGKVANRNKGQGYSSPEQGKYSG
jgi:hypothetical protein